MQNVSLYLQHILKQEGLPNYYNIGFYITETPHYLIISDVPVPLLNKEFRRKKVAYITPDDSDFLSHAGLVDINTSCWIPSEANCGKSNTGESIILSEETEEGRYILIPFNTKQVLKHRGSTIKGFFLPASKLPYEKVSSTDRGGIRRLVIAAIQEIFRQKGIPYIRISYVPGNSPSLFGIRLDTDFCPLPVIKQAVNLADKIGMRWTWFINTGALASALKDLKSILAGQDIQIHCYRHWVYEQVDENRKNISTARELLNKHGINPTGVAGPYGEWNINFQRALEQLGIEYSSEFSYSYDDLPGRPIIDNQKSPVVQIPVHPVSMGRLAWAKANHKAILKYYQGLIDRQVARSEPCFIYDHPEWIVKYKELWQDIIQYGKERCGNWSTLTEYYQWWCGRERSSYTVIANGKDLEIKAEPPTREMSLVINYNGQKAVIPFSSERINIDNLVWTEITYLKFNRLEVYTRRLPFSYLLYENLREIRKQLILQKEKKERE